MSSLDPNPHRIMSIHEYMSADDFVCAMNASTFAEALACFASRTMADVLAAAGMPIPPDHIATAAIPGWGSHYWFPYVGPREPGTRTPDFAYTPAEFVQLVRDV